MSSDPFPLKGFLADPSSLGRVPQSHDYEPSFPESPKLEVPYERQDKLGVRVRVRAHQS